MLPAPPPFPVPARRGGAGGEPCGAQDAVSARDIAEKTLLIGHAAPGSAAAGTSAGGRGGGVAALPAPLVPSPRGSPPGPDVPPLPGCPLDPGGGGGFPNTNEG